jgi:hypothetical protein
MDESGGDCYGKAAKGMEMLQENVRKMKAVTVNMET